MDGTQVAIIGAGLGGLCLAQALTRAGIDCVVYERDAGVDSRSQGYRLRIDADGADALARCLSPTLYDLFRRTCAVPAPRTRFLDGQLAPVTGRAPAVWSAADDGAPHREAAGDLCAHRQTLREILLTGVADRVRFGAAFQALAEGADGRVHVAFADGTSVRADLVVAADGINSAVRRQLMPQAEPLDVGAVCLYGRTTLTPQVRAAVGDDLCAGTSVVFADGYAGIVEPMLFDPTEGDRGGLSLVDDYLYWALIGPRTRLMGRFPGAAPAVVADHLARDWHPQLCGLFRHADPRDMALLPVRSARLARTWPCWAPRPVTFLGDAIHAMSPAGGLGANVTLRDAAVLAASLSRIPSASAAAREYEAEMRTRAARAIHLSEVGAAALFADVF
ncbi:MULTISPECIES: FAD-dependent oxidoreductase [Nitrospirillum]|uniref:2-polyprenyl-6-methoxyphenol hydroxylase-like FAD-dependent oxidoreductase n=1 Tax=Nitrospirillum amazonense TaxID=28077 RepID=A0A560FQU3_9PROT|nr:NAD(P)/FAD-dependent oxidoreductase [Nitrospirillum amazonense]MEC4592904.1 NAD(P)/FAD-dependent oxidoreductase [Nitrospirillum amazonense]TWB23900.1 2-polyprenyl-6-methoxyphenol hydroxylase-like FAD-dependent oxidoreductase [Nitrospirillum amazonense]